MGGCQKPATEAEIVAWIGAHRLLIDDLYRLKRQMQSRGGTVTVAMFEDALRACHVECPYDPEQVLRVWQGE